MEKVFKGIYLLPTLIFFYFITRVFEFRKKGRKKNGLKS